MASKDAASRACGAVSEVATRCPWAGIPSPTSAVTSACPKTCTGDCDDDRMRSLLLGQKQISSARYNESEWCKTHPWFPLSGVLLPAVGRVMERAGPKQVKQQSVRDAVDCVRFGSSYRIWLTNRTP